MLTEVPLPVEVGPVSRRNAALHTLVQLTENVLPPAMVVLKLRSSASYSERLMYPEIRTVLSNMGEHVAEVALVHDGLVFDWALEEAVVTKGMGPVIEARVNGMVTAARLADWWNKNAGSVYSRSYKRMTRLMDGVMASSGVKLTQRDVIARGLMAAGGKQLGLVDLDDSTKSSIFRALDRARQEGLNPREIAREIRRQVPAGRFVNAGPKYRAQLIARTEMLHAQRVSSLLAYAMDPLIQQVQAFDGDGDEHCIERNGRIFTVDQAMEIANSTHPNCVLAFGPVV